jgi:MFS family permease
MAIVKAAPQNQERANYHHLVMDVSWYGLALPATDRFLSVYAIHLGADANQLTWLASLPALMLLFSASLGSWWVRRYTDSAKAVFWPGIGLRLIFLLPALTPFMPHNFQITWLILSLAVPAVPQGIASVSFLVMFREAVNEKLVSPLLSSRFLALNIAVGLSGLALGVWLEHIAFPVNYQLMFVTAFVLTLISMWHITRIRVLPTLVSPPQQTHASGVSPWRSPAFQTVAFIVVLTHLTFFSIRPLIPLHLVSNMGANEGFISLFALAELAAGAAVTLVVRRIVDRIGNRSMIAAAMTGVGLSGLIIATADNLSVTLLAAALGGASWTAVAIGAFAFFSESTPIEAKASYTTAYNQVVFLAMFLGPMIGNVLSGNGMPLVTIILVGALLRILAGLLTHTHPRSWMGKALSHSTHQPLSRG